MRGAIAAFKLEERRTARCELTPAWLSRDMNQADPAVIANGVVFGFGNGEDATQSTVDIGLAYNTAREPRRSTRRTPSCYAFDARTGEELWSSGDQIASFNHFTSLSIANGRVYIGTFDGMLYAFGVDKPAGTRWAESTAHDAETMPDCAAHASSPSRRSALALGRAARRAAAQPREWTTSGFDAQRTAWVRSDVRARRRPPIEKGTFKFLWKAHVRQRGASARTR